MKILVTGGAGFIGRWFLRALPDAVEVTVVDALSEQVHGSRPAFPADVQARARCLHCDVRDTAGWIGALIDVDVVVHLAAMTGTGQSMYQQRRYIENNVLGTSVLVEALAAMRPRPRRLVLASSRAVYGEGAFLDGGRVVYPGPRRQEDLAQGRWEVDNATRTPLTPAPTSEHAPLHPSSIYGLTKAWQEELVARFAEASGVEQVVFRFQNVYGPQQQLENPYTGIVGVFASAVAAQRRVELFEDGEMTRDFVYVGDVAKALVAAIMSPMLDGTLNVGSGRAVSLRRLVGELGRIAGCDPDIWCSGRFRGGDVRHAVADMSTFERVLGSWQPTPLEQGLADYYRWFIEQPPPPDAALTASLGEMEREGLLLQQRQR